MKLNIDNTEYNIKYNIRTLFIFEQISGKPFEVKTLLDEYTLFYCGILSGTKDCKLSFNDFIDWCDDNPKAISDFLEYIAKENDRRKMYEHNDEKKTESNSA